MINRHKFRIVMFFKLNGIDRHRLRILKFALNKGIFSTPFIFLEYYNCIYVQIVQQSRVRHMTKDDNSQLETT